MLEVTLSVYVIINMNVLQLLLNNRQTKYLILILF